MKKHKLPSASKDIRRRLRKDRELASAVQLEHAKLVLAHKLAELRENMGLSQTRMADKMGVSPQLISRIERGEQNITLETLIKCLHVLKVTATLDFTEVRKVDGELLQIA